jgi:hypothetical protein
MTFQVPMYCPSCNALYGGAIALGDASTVVVGVNVKFRCPRGHISTVPEGVIDVKNGVLHIARDGEPAIPILESIRRLAQEAVDGKADTDATIEAISALAPSLAPILKIAKGSGGLVILALILWFVVQMTNTLQSSGKSGANVEGRPTIVNQITINERVAPRAELTPTDRSIESHHGQDSKRKKRRLKRAR